MGLLIFSIPGTVQLVALIVYISTDLKSSQGTVTGLLAADLVTAIAALLWIALRDVQLDHPYISRFVFALPFVCVACTNTIAFSKIKSPALVKGFMGFSVSFNVLWMVFQLLLKS